MQAGCGAARVVQKRVGLAACDKQHDMPGAMAVTDAQMMIIINAMRKRPELHLDAVFRLQVLTGGDTQRHSLLPGQSPCPDSCQGDIALSLCSNILQ